MRLRFCKYNLKAALGTAALLFVPSCGFAQAGWGGATTTEVPAAKAERSASAAKSAVPTSHVADGHPDLNGLWGSQYDNYPVDKIGNVTHIGFGKRPNETRGDPLDINDQDAIELLLTRKDGLGGESVHDTRIADYKKNPNHMPPYKPELLGKVADMDLHAIQLDPSFTCHQPGIPRIGPPDQIVQTSAFVVLIYSRGTKNAFRLIPTDGRPHRTDLDPSYYGDSVAHWEGETMVIDVTNIDDSTWLGNDGWFHSDKLHVIERLTREGNSLIYQVTVEDPKTFTHPWVREPRKIELTTDPVEALYETPPCAELESTHMTTFEHH